jgi:nucleotide-binding universal stress UspA family protein
MVSLILQKERADLIGLSTHGRTGLAHFFTGSISEDLVKPLFNQLSHLRYR